LLCSDDVILFNIPIESIQDHSFCKLADTAGETDRSVGRWVFNVFTLFKNRDDFGAFPLIGNVLFSPGVVDDFEQLFFAYLREVENHLIADLIFARRLAKVKSLSSFVVLLSGKHAAIFGSPVVTLGTALANFILPFSFNSSFSDGIIALNVTFFGVLFDQLICFFFFSKDKIVSFPHSRLIVGLSVSAHCLDGARDFFRLSFDVEAFDFVLPGSCLFFNDDAFGFFDLIYLLFSL